MEIVKLERGGRRSFWVLGTNYENPKIVLENFLGSEEFIYVGLSLTPRSQYQKQQEFPPMPFINVCTPGSVVATKDNWIGYIGSDNRDFDNKTFNNLVKIVEQCNVEIRCRLYRLDNSNVGVVAYASAGDINKKFSKLDTLPKREKITEPTKRSKSFGNIIKSLFRKV